MANQFKLDDDSLELNKKQGSFGTATTTTTESSSTSTGGFLEMAKSVAVVGGAALAAGWGLYSLLSSSSSETEEKLMKAPGKNGEYIRREPFEDNPRKYFQELRNSKR